MALRRYFENKYEQMANRIEEPIHGIVASGNFAAAAGSDFRARIRHRLFASDRNSNGFVRSGCHRFAVERAGDSGCQLFGDAAAADADFAVCSDGRLDVFIGAAVQAGNNANACLADWIAEGFRKRGESHAGSLARDCRADGAADDLGFDSGFAAGSGSGKRARRVRRCIEGYLT